MGVGAATGAAHGEKVPARLGQRNGCRDRDWEAAYEATLLAAVLNAARGGSRRLLLTRLGGGAFGNDDERINAAILRALRRVENQGLDVLMVSFGPPSAAIRAIEKTWGDGQAER
jgi:hypothetical protein